MDTSEWAAVAAVVSATMALGSLVVSIWSVVRSTNAVNDAQVAREMATTAQWKMTEHLQVIAEAQATMAQALSAKGSGTYVAGSPISQGGRLSARLVHRGRSDRIVVANVGVEEVEVLSVEVDPDVLVEGDASVEGVSLEPGEDFTLIAALTFGDALPLNVTMRWRDSEGERERTQKVTYS